MRRRAVAAASLLLAVGAAGAVARPLSAGAARIDHADARPAQDPKSARCMGEKATIVGTGANDEIMGTPRRDVIWTGPGADAVKGSGGSDLICTSGDQDAVIGGGGDDRISTGAGIDAIGPEMGDDVVRSGRGEDTVDFSGIERRVQVSLATNSSRGQGNDSLFGVENVIGTTLPDALRGDESTNFLVGLEANDIMDGAGGADILQGFEGDDQYVGGEGSDTASFNDDPRENPTPVSVNLLEGRATSSTGTDSLIDMENIIGSGEVDELVGDDGANVIDGVCEDDQITAGGGDDVIIPKSGATVDGGPGSDWVDYMLNTCREPGVMIDLSAGTTTFDSSSTTQRLTSIENARGSNGDDEIIGSDEANQLLAEAGNDVVDGRDGDDLIDGGLHSDTVDGGDGSRDQCLNAEFLENCENVDGSSTLPALLHRLQQYDLRQLSFVDFR